MKSWVRVLAVMTAVTALGASAQADAASVPSGVVPDLPTGATLSQFHLPSRGALDYQGGPVMHSNHTFIIFWNPSNCTFNSSPCAYDAGYQAMMTTFLTSVAADSHKATNVYALDGQYSDSTGIAAYDSTFVRAVQDTDAAPANGCTLTAPPPVSTGPGWTMCLSDSQLRTEIAHVVSANHLPTGITDLFFLVTPNGVGTCFSSGPNDCSVSGGGNPSGTISGSFCGYHTAMGTVGNPTLYANIPYDAVTGHCQSGNPRPNSSTADPTISTLSHEQNEAITDPLAQGPGNPLSGWVQNSDGQEIGDLCATSYGTAIGGGPTTLFNENVGTGHYLLQEEWSNEDGGCAQRDETDSVAFSSAPSAPTVGQAVAFSGHGSDPDGHIASFAWSFGDGSTGSGPAPSHAYGHAGDFTVVLTTTDSAGQRASTARVVHVAGAKAKITKLKTRSHGASVTVTISTNAAGRVAIGTRFKTLTHAGTVSFTIRLNKHGRRLLHKHHHLTAHVKVTFTPKHGAPISRKVALHFHS